MIDNTPRPALRRNGPSLKEKRRNRRRKSRYSRPLLSLAHALVLLLVLLAAGFALAVAVELLFGERQARGPARPAPGDGLALPGSDGPAAAGRRMAPPGVPQLMLWAYIFGSPAIFAIHRFVFWSRTWSTLKLISYLMIGLWCAVMVVLLVLASQA